MTTRDSTKVVSTAMQVRSNLFQATRRPVALKEHVIETSWWKGTITGRLGQAHEDMLEACLLHAHAKDVLPDGRVRIAVDPYLVRKELGGGPKGRCYSYEQTQLLKSDLEEVTFRIDQRSSNSKATKVERIAGHIIDRWKETEVTLRVNPARWEGKEDKRSLWVIIFGEDWSRDFENNIKLRYDPRPIFQLKSGSNQAAARLLLSHNGQANGGWKLGELLKAVNAPGRLRDRIKDFHNEVAQIERCGFSVIADRVFKKGADQARTPATRARAAATKIDQSACSRHQILVSL